MKKKSRISRKIALFLLIDSHHILMLTKHTETEMHEEWGMIGKPENMSFTSKKNWRISEITLKFVEKIR